MKRADVQSIEDLCVLMDAEAKKWGREGFDNATGNRAGIMEQWGNREKRAYLEIPMCIHALIGTDPTPWPEEVVQAAELPAGTRSNVTFQLLAFYFDDVGNRVERPAEELKKLADAQAHEENDNA